MGVKTTRVVKYIRKGDKGDKGDNGRLPIPYGQYDGATTYVCTDKIAPYVLEGQFYYVMNKTTSYRGATVGRSPAQDYAQYGSNATWILLENYKAIFVELLMANLGLIGKAVFYGQYMFSQYGKIGSTEVSTEGQYAVPTDAGGTFNPNFIVNFLTGELRCNRGEFAGGLRVPFKLLSESGITFQYRSSHSKPGTGGDVYDYYYQLNANTARYIDLSEHVEYYNQGTIITVPALAALDGCRFVFTFPLEPNGYNIGDGFSLQVPTGGAIISDDIIQRQVAEHDHNLITYVHFYYGGLVEILIRIINNKPYVYITSGYSGS